MVTPLCRTKEQISIIHEPTNSIINGSQPPCCVCPCPCQLSPPINEYTYCVLKKICRRILKEIHHEQRRERYSIFDGGNSMKYESITRGRDARRNSSQCSRLSQRLSVGSLQKMSRLQKLQGPTRRASCRGSSDSQMKKPRRSKDSRRTSKKDSEKKVEKTTDVALPVVPDLRQKVRGEKSGTDTSVKDKSAKDTSSKDKDGKGKADKDKLGQDKPGQDKSAKDKDDRDYSGQAKSDKRKASLSVDRSRAKDKPGTSDAGKSKSSDAKSEKDKTSKSDKEKSDKDKSDKEKSDKDKSKEKPEKAPKEKPDKAAKEKPEKPAKEKPEKPAKEKPEKAPKEKPDKAAKEKPEKAPKEKPDKPIREKPEKPVKERLDRERGTKVGPKGSISERQPIDKKKKDIIPTRKVPSGPLQRRSGQGRDMKGRTSQGGSTILDLERDFFTKRRGRCCGSMNPPFSRYENPCTSRAYSYRPRYPAISRVDAIRPCDYLRAQMEVRDRCCPRICDPCCPPCTPCLPCPPCPPCRPCSPRCPPCDPCNPCQMPFVRCIC